MRPVSSFRKRYCNLEGAPWLRHHGLSSASGSCAHLRCKFGNGWARRGGGVADVNGLWSAFGVGPYNPGERNDNEACSEKLAECRAPNPSTGATRKRGLTG